MNLKRVNVPLKMIKDAANVLMNGQLPQGANSITMLIPDTSITDHVVPPKAPKVAVVKEDSSEGPENDKR